MPYHAWCGSTQQTQSQSIERTISINQLIRFKQRDSRNKKLCSIAFDSFRQFSRHDEKRPKAIDFFYSDGSFRGYFSIVAPRARGLFRVNIF